MCFDPRGAPPLGCVPSADLESRSPQGVLARLDPVAPGLLRLENTTLDFQKLPDKEVLRAAGPLGSDLTVRVRPGVGGAADEAPPIA